MQNQRQLKRRKLKQEIGVSLNAPSSVTGLLLDITDQGLLFLGNEGVEAFVAYSLDIHLPNPIQGKKFLELKALSRWSKPDAESGLIMTGFELLLDSQKEVTQVHLLMERYCER